MIMRQPCRIRKQVKKRIAFLVCGGFVAMNAQASDDWGMWLSHTYQGPFAGSPWLGFLEIAPRTKKDNSRFNQIIIRPALGYQLTQHWQLWLGYTWQGEYDTARDFELATHDVFQQVVWIKNLTPSLNFQYRARLEQRFFAEVGGVAHRLRQRWRFEYSLPDSQAYLIAADELFIYFNDLNNSRVSGTVQSGVNQNRIYGGIGYNLAPGVKIDTGYQLQYVNQFNGQDLFNHVWLTNFNVFF